MGAKSSFCLVKERYSTFFEVNMLIEFTVGNYKSFKNPVTFSMLASSLTEHRDTHVFRRHKFDLLKSSVIFGANASGKSNLFDAISFMKEFIFSSAKDMQISEKIKTQSFKLSTETENKPSMFEIIFFIDQIRYRYGFQVTEEKVEAEWLFCVPTRVEAKLFTREDNKIILGDRFKEGKGIEEKTRNNALFLSVVAQFNGTIASRIIKWFDQLNIISGLGDEGYMGFTFDKMDDPVFRNWAVKFLATADIDILNIIIKSQEFDVKNLPKNVQKFITLKKIEKDEIKAIKGFSARSYHQKYNNKNKKVSLEEFDVAENESEGTKKLFFLSGPIWDTLNNGKILFIDEFEARLHKKLVISLIKLFNSSRSNSKNAQFVLATHDTNILKSEFFRRDQIWFIEKDRYGASDLYSLAEYKILNKIARKDTLYNKNYLIGKYGAIPLVNDFEELFEAEDGK